MGDDFDISDENLELAAKMFLYIIAPQDQYWIDWHKKYSDWMTRYSIRRLLSMNISIHFSYFILSQKVPGF